MDDKSILKISTNVPGPTVAIFAGVHGNEKAGIMAVEKIKKMIKLTRGTCYFVIANPEAVNRNVRFIEKNLNRLFSTQTGHATFEEKRAWELMGILDGCDALLDIHGYNGNEDEPFIITGESGLDIASKLDFAHIITGINQAGDGATDCYMAERGKIGLCLECGSNFQPEQYVSLAEKSIYQFLHYFDLIISDIDFDRVDQRLYKVVEISIRQNDNFHFDKEYKNFDALVPGAIFAVDGPKEYVASADQFIVFPRPNQKIGQESFTRIQRLES